LPILTCGELLRRYPERRPAVIEGLLREGETMNVIASSKRGKSWLILSLLFAIGLGRRWLDTFDTTQGRVLLIDNELHEETSAHRIRTMANSLGIPIEDIADSIHTVNLRGRLQDLFGLGRWLLRIKPFTYKLVVIDAWYRTMPGGTDENDNGAMARLYNLLDSYAEALRTSFSLIHHSSKGNQTSKQVVDVGSGAGSMSRAVDSHVVLRPHEEDDVVVMEAAVRSWPPVEPRCLRYEFPSWTLAPELDPTALLKPRRSKKAASTKEQHIEAKWDAKRFADVFGRPEEMPRSIVLDEARKAGLSDRKAETLLKAAIDREYLFQRKERGANSRRLISTQRREDKQDARKNAK
jgi:hypothetical protein